MQDVVQLVAESVTAQAQVQDQAVALGIMQGQAVALGTMQGQAALEPARATSLAVHQHLLARDQARPTAQASAQVLQCRHPFACHDCCCC